MRVNLALAAVIGSAGALALHSVGRHLRQQAQSSQAPRRSTASEPAVTEPAPPAEPAPQHDVALRAAAERGDAAAVQWLLAAAPEAALAPDERGRLPLHLACLGRHEAVARLLVAAAPQAASTLDSSERTPLFLAATAGDAAIADLLLAAAPAAAVTLCDGSLPIHAAAAAGHVEAARRLAAAAPGAAASTDADGLTPLELALSGRHISTARCLLDAGPAATALRTLAEAGEAALPLFADLVAARPALTAEEWALVPAPCPGLGRALPAVLERSPEQAAQLVAHLPADEVQALRAAGTLPRVAPPAQGSVSRLLSMLRKRRD